MSSDEATEVASKESIKEGREDSMKPREGEKSMKLSMKEEGIGTEGGSRGARWEADARRSTKSLR